MAEPVRREHEIYKYSDYATWPDDKRYEVIKGIAYTMAPAPGERHQWASIALSSEFFVYMKGKKCRVYSAPFDVILPEKGETFETSTNVVQPDIVVICDKDKITHRGCCGAPDLVVEILSPSTALNDMKNKRKLYQRFGVKEYWIVDPVHKTVQVYKLDKKGKYSFPETYAVDDRIKVGIFNDDLEIDLALVFGG